MSDHDPMCRRYTGCDHGDTTVCHCALVEDVRADERGHVAKRVAAMLRWLTDEGHITPMGSRQVQRVVQGE